MKQTQSEKEAAKLRVRIAKDVLKSIKTLTVRPGRWIGTLDGDSLKDKWGDSKDSKKQATALKKECQVCALGGLMLSTVCLLNEFNWSKGHYYSVVKQDSMFDRLLDHFDGPQLLLIENAFELGHGGLAIKDYNGEFSESQARDAARNVKIDWPSIDNNQVDRAIAFGERYKTPKGRLRGIMNNLINNHGTFVP